MKTLNTNFKLWPGDDVYYINKGKIIESYIWEIRLSFSINTQGVGHNDIEYVLSNGTKITNSDIDTIYFTNKKDLIKYLVEQI